MGHEDGGGGLFGSIGQFFEDAGITFPTSDNADFSALGDARDFLVGEPGPSAPQTSVQAAPEDLILSVLQGGGLVVDFNNVKVQDAIVTIEGMIGFGLDRDAILSFINQEFAAELEAGALSPSDPSGTEASTDGAPRGLGLTEAQVVAQFETSGVAQDRGFTLSFGAGGAVVKSPTGKVIQSFTMSEDGLFHPVLGEEAGGGTGGGSAGQAARDARGIFEDTRDFAEDVFKDRRNFGEDVRRFDLGFDEDITQNRLSEGRLNRADVGNLGARLGELNLRMQEHIATILREPADFLARAFTQRGGTSPFPEITQADLINQLRTEFQRIRDFTAEQLGLNSAQIAQLPSPSPSVITQVSQALAPAAELISKSVTTREATGGGDGGAAATGGGGGSLFPPLDDSEFDLGFVGNELGRPAPSFVEPTLDFDELGEQGLTEPQVARPGGFLGGFLDATPRPTDGGFLAPAPTKSKFVEPTLDFNEVDEFAHGTPEKNKAGKKGGADNELSLVGEAGPELMINHGDGSFDIISNDDLMGLMKTNKKKKKDTDTIQAFAEGTLGGLTPDDLGRLSLFDQIDVRQTSAGELESNALLATPPGPSSVLSGTKIPDLDVAGGSGFKLFSPQQFDALTPDEQVALRTRLASKNRSLTDFLFASQRAFLGTPRNRPRAVFDVTK